MVRIKSNVGGEIKEGAMIAEIQNYFKDNDGATAIEYGLTASLIAVVIIADITLAGGSLTTTFNNIAASM